MDEATRTNLRNIYTLERDVQTQAYFNLLSATEEPVDWAYEVWDELFAGLQHKDNHVRSIAAQLLSNLAKSDPENRMLTDFYALLAVTKDSRGVTARHSLQAIWKVGLAGEPQRKMLVEALTRRFHESTADKHSTLVRYDILQGLRNLYDAVGDETIREQALALIEVETDPKYRKKYVSVWKGIPKKT